MPPKDNTDKYFTRWINMHLRTRAQKVKDICEDFKDGQKLSMLLEILSKTKFPGKLMPDCKNNKLFYLSNLKVVLDFAKPMVKRLQVDGNNFVNGTEIDRKMLLGFIFDLIIHYQVDDINFDSAKSKDGLLLWCQKNTANTENVDVKNFTTSWGSGLAFMALGNAYDKSMFDMAKEQDLYTKAQALDDEGQLLDASQRLMRAFKKIEEVMDVEQLLDEEFAEFQSDQANVCYLSLIYKAFNEIRKKGKNSSMLQKMIKQQRHLEQLQDLIKELLAGFNEKADTELKVVAENSVKVKSTQDIDGLQNIISDQLEFDQQQIPIVNNLLTKYQMALSNLNKYRSSYGRPGDFVPQEGQEVDAFQKTADQIRQNSAQVVLDARAKIASMQSAKRQTQRDAWLQLFVKWAKSDPEHKLIYRPEIEQLLIVLDQDIDGETLDQLYVDGKKVNFEDFCQLMESLVNDQFSLEQALEAFKLIGKGPVVTVVQLKEAKLSDEDIAWLSSHLDQAEQGAFSYEEAVKKMYQ